MLRIGETQIINQIIDQAPKNNRLEKAQNLISEFNMISKEKMWRKFLETFCAMYNKEFIQNERTINNLKVIFFYFLKDEKFFDCDNLRGDIIKPSFKKGLLIIGGFGVGKTDYFKVFEEMFRINSNLRFKSYPAKELVLKYEHCTTTDQKDYFFKDVSRPKMFIDDIASERIASNYGKVDVIKDVLSNRYEKRLLTYASCNYTSEEQCVKRTLEDIGERYGSRIYDRLFEMFNVIEFKGKSFRK